MEKIQRKKALKLGSKKWSGVEKDEINWNW